MGGRIGDPEKPEVRAAVHPENTRNSTWELRLWHNQSSRLETFQRNPDDGVMLPRLEVEWSPSGPRERGEHERRPERDGAEDGT